MGNCWSEPSLPRGPSFCANQAGSPEMQTLGGSGCCGGSRWGRTPTSITLGCPHHHASHCPAAGGSARSAFPCCSLCPFLVLFAEKPCPDAPALCRRLDSHESRMRATFPTQRHFLQSPPALSVLQVPRLGQGLHPESQRRLARQEPWQGREGAETIPK